MRHPNSVLRNWKGKKQNLKISFAGRARHMPHKKRLKRQIPVKFQKGCLPEVLYSILPG